MKKITASLLLACICIILAACNNGQVINGHTIKTAMRSVKMLKERLPTENRIEFEVAYWTLRDANKDDNQFLSLVDGKNPLEIIEMGQKVYQERKNSGFQGYERYSSWGEMITKFGRERIDQENRKGLSKASEQEKENRTVLYKLNP